MNWKNNNDGPWGSGGNNPWGGSSKRDLDESIILIELVNSGGGSIAPTKLLLICIS